MNTGNYVAIKGVCATLPDDIKEVYVYKDWSYKIQNYIEHHEQHQMGIDNGFPKTLNEAKYTLLMNHQWAINNI